MLHLCKFDQEIFSLDLRESGSSSGRLREFERKGEDQLVIAKSDHGRLRELVITVFDWQVVVTKASRLQDRERAQRMASNVLSKQLKFL